MGGGGGGVGTICKGSIKPPLPSIFWRYSGFWLLSYLAKLMRIAIEGPELQM